MKHNLEDYNYELPKELIAQRPIEPRTHSKLMVLENSSIIHKKFYEIITYLKEGDVLVLNETKVYKNKLVGKKETGGIIELMVDPTSNEATVKGKVKPNQTLFFEKNIQAKILTKEDNKITLKFSIPTKEVLEKIGKLPTPPYIKEDLKNDNEYQTCFAKKEGSFACPTASLHFDQELLRKIQAKGAKLAKVCLHVSSDTFLPVKEKDYTKHTMHGEYCEIDKTNCEIINKAKRLFVVGTTALRTLESLSKKDGLVYPQTKTTKLFIYPGYKFNLNYAGLITNFHLPKSTLLLMISALLSKEEILNAYNVAIKKDYRFFSLGDAMLILK